MLSTVFREEGIQVKVVEKLLELPLNILYYHVTSLCLQSTSSKHPATQSLEIGL